jgi:hypothetical protein
VQEPGEPFPALALCKVNHLIISFHENSRLKYFKWEFSAN